MRQRRFLGWLGLASGTLGVVGFLLWDWYWPTFTLEMVALGLVYYATPDKDMSWLWETSE